MKVTLLRHTYNGLDHYRPILPHVEHRLIDVDVGLRTGVDGVHQVPESDEGSCPPHASPEKEERQKNNNIIGDFMSWNCNGRLHSYSAQIEIEANSR